MQTYSYDATALFVMVDHLNGAAITYGKKEKEAILVGRRDLIELATAYADHLISKRCVYMEQTSVTDNLRAHNPDSPFLSVEDSDTGESFADAVVQTPILQDVMDVVRDSIEALIPSDCTSYITHELKYNRFFIHDYGDYRIRRYNEQSQNYPRHVNLATLIGECEAYLEDQYLKEGEELPPNIGVYLVQAIYNTTARDTIFLDNDLFDTNGYDRISQEILSMTGEQLHYVAEAIKDALKKEFNYDIDGLLGERQDDMVRVMTWSASPIVTVRTFWRSEGIRELLECHYSIWTDNVQSQEQYAAYKQGLKFIR